MTVNWAYKFVKETPKYQASIDRVFWRNNARDMDKLASKGCKLINRNRELQITKDIQIADENRLFVSKRNLSGVFALSYAVHKLHCDNVYLFGYDFGPINGETHFYNNIEHSGIGKDRAYLNKDGSVLAEVNDFEYFKKFNISIVGESNIKILEHVSYKQFKKEISNNDINPS